MEENEAIDSNSSEPCVDTIDIDNNSDQSRIIDPNAEARASQSSSFARLVAGWETWNEEKTQKVNLQPRQEGSFKPMQMLQNLSLCGFSENPGSTGKGNVEGNDDPFDPIVLRHAHSFPAHMFNKEATPGGPHDFSMKRSRSNPLSTSGERSGFEAFDRSSNRSAFSLPALDDQKSRSDSGIHYSAFKPVALTTTVLSSSKDDYGPVKKRFNRVDTGKQPESSNSSETVEDQNIKSSGNPLNRVSTDVYQQLDSDIDEEYEHRQTLESPSSIPSPTYQKLEDEDTGCCQGSISTPSNPAHSDCVDNSVGSPNSQDTSGHTTVAPSSSETVSTGLSSTNEDADREVRETNHGERRRRRTLGQKLRKSSTRSGMDTSKSVTSNSTSSTNTEGYIALTESAVPLREGACLPADRFFVQNSTSPRPFSRISGDNPFNDSSISSPVSLNSKGQEDPPRLVSGKTPRESPFPYPQPVRLLQKRKMEEKKRPSQNTSSKVPERPPRSPFKVACWTPSPTPPSSQYNSLQNDPRCGSESISPAYYQLSPPRNIFDPKSSIDVHDQVIGKISRPNVVRYSASLTNEFKEAISG